MDNPNPPPLQLLGTVAHELTIAHAIIALLLHHLTPTEKQDCATQLAALGLTTGGMMRENEREELLRAFGVNVSHLANLANIEGAQRIERDLIIIDPSYPAYPVDLSANNPTEEELRQALQALVSAQDAGSIAPDVLKAWKTGNALLARFADHPDNPENMAAAVAAAMAE